MKPLTDAEETRLSIRRKTLFGTNGMRLLELAPLCQTVDIVDVLPFIAQHTHGDFYLSEFTVGFKDPADILMFKLAFKK